MSEPTSGPTSGGASGPASGPASGSTHEPTSGSPTPGKRPPGWARLAGPLVALAAGLAIGYGIWGAGEEEADRDAERVVALPPPPTPSTAPSIATSEVRAQVPSACVDAVGHAEQALRLVEQGLAAAGRFDARELERLFGEIRPLQPQLREAAATCRQGVTVQGRTPAPTPS